MWRCGKCGDITAGSLHSIYTEQITLHMEDGQYSIGERRNFTQINLVNTSVRVCVCERGSPQSHLFCLQVD